MIGYYVHHVGAGHLQHARALERHASQPVTGLSSLPAPADWRGDWVHLPRDDAATTPLDVTARGALHWVPMGETGLRNRMASLASWIARAAPDVLVVDVSVEVALLARLHGVPVVSVVLPGHRGDRPHRLGYGLSSALVATWPAHARTMVLGLPGGDARRLTHIGGVSRFPVRTEAVPDPAGRVRRVTLLCGAGGGHPTSEQVERARAQTPTWEWTVLGGPTGTWVSDPYDALCSADVVVSQAGLAALADVAAARRPAVVIPSLRPHDEQVVTASVLRHGPWPAVVQDRWPDEGWGGLLGRAASLDPAPWADWTDGGAGARFAEVVEGVAGSDAGDRS